MCRRPQFVASLAKTTICVPAISVYVALQAIVDKNLFYIVPLPLNAVSAHSMGLIVLRLVCQNVDHNCSNLRHSLWRTHSCICLRGSSGKNDCGLVIIKREHQLIIYDDEMKKPLRKALTTLPRSMPLFHLYSRGRLTNSTSLYDRRSSESAQPVLMCVTLRMPAVYSWSLGPTILGGECGENRRESFSRGNEAL